MEATVTAAAAKVFGENHTAIYFTVGLELWQKFILGFHLSPTNIYHLVGELTNVNLFHKMSTQLRKRTNGT